VPNTIIISSSFFELLKIKQATLFERRCSCSSRSLQLPNMSL